MEKDLAKSFQAHFTKKNSLNVAWKLVLQLGNLGCVDEFGKLVQILIFLACVNDTILFACLSVSI